MAEILTELARVLESSVDPAVVVDRELRVLHYNRAFLHLADLKPRELKDGHGRRRTRAEQPDQLRARQPGLPHRPRRPLASLRGGPAGAATRSPRPAAGGGPAGRARSGLRAGRPSQARPGDQNRDRTDDWDCA